MIDILDLDIILNTCKSTEIPPKPKIKEQSIILIDIFLFIMQEISLTPIS